MAEDDSVKDENGNIINIEDIVFESWQVELLKKLKEWFPDG